VKIYPAIDLLGGKVVRLHQGDFGESTVYGDDPVGVATLFADAGAHWVHVVDLDAARTGSPVNRAVIARIASEVNVHVQAGGGVRDQASVDELLGAGVARVVIGTTAIANRELTVEMARRSPNRVVIGLDAREGKVAGHGWISESELTVFDLIESYRNIPIAAYVITDITRDGTMQGPDVDGLRRAVEATTVPVIASGGIGSLDDLRAVRAVGVEGAITGKAIYEGRFTVQDAVLL
jgi:phosphoribosylformimino-5-aminoimidazole carboxamide ribotide isomerase